jgi:NitT/TauT family transport system substrate-binding protein
MSSAPHKVTPRWLLLAIAVILAGPSYLVLQSCASAPVRQHTWKIGLGPWVGFGPLYLAQEKGFFREAGLETELVVLTGLAERNSALKSGGIDALAAPVDYFVLSAGNNLETSIVMMIDESTGGDGIVARGKIKEIRDLKGKRVAVQRGLPGEFFLRALLQRSSLSIDDLKTTDMETAQAGAAFISKKIDAAVVWQPWLDRAKSEGGGHILASTRDFPDLIVDCLAFNKDVVAKDPDGVQKIINAVFRAIQYIRQNQAESYGIMAPHFQVDAQKYAALVSDLEFADVARNRRYFAGPIFEVGKTASEIWLQAKNISKPVEPQTIIEPKFIGTATEQ